MLFQSRSRASRTLAVLLLIGLPVSVYAQTRGAITSVVKDSTGGIIPGASVKVSNQATGTSEAARTQNDGAYVTPPLQAGYYTISVTAPGFKQHEAGGLKVDVGTTLTHDIVLEVGLVTETDKERLTGSKTELCAGK